MKSDDLSPGIDRRTLALNLILLPFLSTTLPSSPIKAQTMPNAPLASWNEGAAKQAILDFVRATTDQGSSKFVPAEDSEPMAENPSRVLEVVVVERDGSWEWRVESEGAVQASGIGSSRLMARFLGNDAKLRLLAEGGKAQE
jgi:hypothetical protein